MQYAPFHRPWWDGKLSKPGREDGNLNHMRSRHLLRLRNHNNRGIANEIFVPIWACFQNVLKHNLCVVQPLFSNARLVTRSWGVRHCFFFIFYPPNNGVHSMLFCSRGIREDLEWVYPNLVAKLRVLTSESSTALSLHCVRASRQRSVLEVRVSSEADETSG